MKTRNIKKSIVAGVTAALAVTAAFSVRLNGNTAAAATATETNGCYTLVAAGTETQACTTITYANNSSDFTLEFDLLKSVDGGSFGFVNGKKSALDLSAEDFGGADYFLSNEEGVVSSSKASTMEFESGYRYILEVKRGEGIVRFSRKPYAIYTTVAAEKLGDWTLEESNANMFGLVVRSDENDATWALIDNWKLSTSSGNSYETFEKTPLSMYGMSSNENGYAQLFKGAYYNVVFMTESGAVIKKVRAQEYTALTCSAPKIEGQKHVGWSEDVTCIQKDMVVLPVYEALPPAIDSSSDSAVDSSSTETSVSGGMQCGGNIDGFGAGGVLIALALSVGCLWKGRREER